MGNLGGTFDPSAVPPSEFDTIPAGSYHAQIIESQVVSTKAGDGKILKLTWEVVAGAFERRKVFENVNIQNSSAKAQEIGQRRLADICEATGVGAISDSDQLHFRPCLIRVAIETDPNYPDKNVVKSVKAIASGARTPPPTAASVAPPASQAQAKAAGSRPWSR